MIAYNCEVELRGVDGDGGLVGGEGIFFWLWRADIEDAIVGSYLFYFLHHLFFDNLLNIISINIDVLIKLQNIQTNDVTLHL
mgnify:CR=1 FL=1